MWRWPVGKYVHVRKHSIIGAVCGVGRDEHGELYSVRRISLDIPADSPEIYTDLRAADLDHIGTYFDERAMLRSLFDAA